MLIHPGGPDAVGSAAAGSPSSASRMRVGDPPEPAPRPGQIVREEVVSRKPTPKVTANPITRVSSAFATLPGVRRAENSAR